jgi:copper chaperone CopZ
MHPLVQATYRVDGMTCGGCVKSVAATLSTVASDIEVTLTPPQARLSAAADLTVAKLNELMGGKYKFTALPTDIESVYPHTHNSPGSFPPFEREVFASSPLRGEHNDDVAERRHRELGVPSGLTSSGAESPPPRTASSIFVKDKNRAALSSPLKGEEEKSREGRGGGDFVTDFRPEISTLETPKTWFETYQPLLLIAAYIALASFAGTFTYGRAGFDWSVWMTNAMAGFFLVFSAFKFLNLKGFAEAYATYDLGAKAWAPWGTIYPFLELLLGCAYLFRWNLPLTNIATILLMGFSSLGVIQALSKKQTIRCACLGTVLNVPMSTITLVEDLAMVGMAALALMGGH